ncbi:MAG: NADH dehydrogenase subunit [candidate division WS1 bacterium]|jgi:NADH-quinone oxidoreductase subunit D|nr:NADH dehydrogenase subunit [candidate division WS1 bacterium]
MAKLSFPVGPQHPALKEPENLRFSVDGELVVDADIRIGYVHRSIERSCSERNYVQDLYLCERVCGICSNAHTQAFCQAVEKIAGVEIPERAQYIRMMMHEFERIHSHMLWLGVAGHEIGFETLFMYVWRDREVIQDILEMVSGNRGHYAMTMLGGVRYDITPEMVTKIREGIAFLRQRAEHYADIATTEATFLKRTVDVGPISGARCQTLGAVGPVLRGSGVGYDVRRAFPYLKYDEVEFEVRTSELCDVLGRTLVRVLEVIDACDIITQVLDMMPEGDITTRFPRKVPEGEATARVEAQRGELIYYVRSNGTDVPERVKIRTPTLANLPASLEMVTGGYIADIPITFASIDPCFSCTDRMVVLDDVNSGDSRTMTWPELVKLGRRS